MRREPDAAEGAAATGERIRRQAARRGRGRGGRRQGRRGYAVVARPDGAVGRRVRRPARSAHPGRRPEHGPDLGHVRPGRDRRRAGRVGHARRRSARPVRALDDVTDASDSPPTKERIEYTLPPLELLEDVASPTEPGGSPAAHARNEEIIIRKLASFGITAQIVARNAGPVVTQYEVQPAVDVRVSRIEALADDLAMALAARSLRIEAPIPGKSAVGIEIPNQDFNVVALRRIFEEVPFSASESKLTFALGRDVAGKAQAVDLAKMPHLLIAGATGSGKSVMVNAVITSLLCKATPDDVRMILMDLKRVELASYNGLPHLLVPVITEPERAKAALKWAVNEMEGRYRRFAGASARNITAYNETRADPEDRLPYIVIIIDELADLMMREGKNVEDPIVRLAQKARATGIHMVLATQRPSVNVVTGLIKANFPSRIAFAMASQIDSRTILDAPGAEDLIGRGDMLYQPSDLPRPMRLQGVFVSDPEIGRVVAALARPDREPALRHGDRRDRRRRHGLRRRSRRRGCRSPPAGCRRGHSGVRSCLGVAPPAAAEGRLRAGRPDHRPAGGARLHRCVRRLERPAGPPPRRRTGDPGAGRRRRRRGRGTMTTRDEARRGTADPRADAGRAMPRHADAVRPDPAARRPVDRAVPSLPERLYAARERKGVDLYRAERDTKIRARYLAALERGDYRELPGAVYTKGFLRNYALYLGPRARGDPHPVAARARRRGPAGAGHRGPAAARRAAPRPDVLAGRRRRGARDGRRPRRRWLPRPSRSCASTSRRRSR